MGVDSQLQEQYAVDIYDTHTGRIMQVPRLNIYDVKGIVEDSDGNMWCTTDRGIICVRVTDKNAPAFILTLFPDQALYNDRAIKLLPDGRIVAGTTDGYELFNPKNLFSSVKETAKDCPLILGTIQINGNNITPNDSLKGRRLISSDLPYVHELNLKYGENHVTLEYLPRNIGMDNNRTWHYCVSGLHDGDQPLIGGRITLSNLSPGTYHIEIYDPNSNQGKNRYKVMTIHIAYPLWLSWWAFLIYIAIAGVVTYVVYILHHRRTAYRNGIRKMKEEARREGHRRYEDKLLRKCQPRPAHTADAHHRTSGGAHRQGQGQRHEEYSDYGAQERTTALLACEPDSRLQKDWSRRTEVPA